MCNITWRLFRAGAILLLLSLTATYSYAQLVSNGGFDNITCSTTSVSPFVTGCVPSWRASHGSPQVKFQTQNGAADNYAYMWAQSGEGEGIYTELPSLAASTTYEIAFVARGYSNPSLAVKLATNLQIGGENSPSGGTIPSGRNIVWNQNFALGTSWTQYIIRITVPNNGTYQLWFYPETAASDGTKREVHINDVFLDRADCPSRDIVFQNTSNVPAIAKTQGNIIAGSNVTTYQTTGPVTILNGQNVFFGAGKETHLEYGFSVQLGAVFEVTQASSNCAVAREAQNVSGWWASDSPPQRLDSTSQAPQARLSTYPNPVAEQLTVTVSNSSSPELELLRPSKTIAVVYNSYGREVKRVHLERNQTAIQVKDLPIGIYYLRTEIDGKPTTVRFSVER